MDLQDAQTRHHRGLTPPADITLTSRQCHHFATQPIINLQDGSGWSFEFSEMMSSQRLLFFYWSDSACVITCPVTALLRLLSVCTPLLYYSVCMFIYCTYSLYTSFLPSFFSSVLTYMAPFPPSFLSLSPPFFSLLSSLMSFVPFCTSSFPSLPPSVMSLFDV